MVAEMNNGMRLSRRCCNCGQLCQSVEPTDAEIDKAISEVITDGWDISPQEIRDVVRFCFRWVDLKVSEK